MCLKGTLHNAAYPKNGNKNKEIRYDIKIVNPLSLYYSRYYSEIERA